MSKRRGKVLSHQAPTSTTANQELARPRRFDLIFSYFHEMTCRKPLICGGLFGGFLRNLAVVKTLLVVF
jgi:hypothetical protein